MENPFRYVSTLETPAPAHPWSQADWIDFHYQPLYGIRGGLLYPIPSSMFLIINLRSALRGIRKKIGWEPVLRVCCFLMRRAEWVRTMFCNAATQQYP